MKTMPATTPPVVHSYPGPDLNVDEKQARADLARLARRARLGQMLLDPVFIAGEDAASDRIACDEVGKVGTTEDLLKALGSPLT